MNQIQSAEENMLLFATLLLFSLQSSILTPIPVKPTKLSSNLSVTNSASYGERISSSTRRRTISPFESRISLIFALASQANSLSQRRKCFPPLNSNSWWFSLLLYSILSAIFLINFRAAVLADVAAETAKYVFPKRFENRNLEEALMSGYYY